MTQQYPNIPPSQARRYSRHNSSVTPGIDNLGPSSVGGGISGIALGVANSHDRLSGVNAVHGMERNDGFAGPAERGFHTAGSDNPYVPPAAYGSSEALRPERSYGSNMGLGAAAAPVGMRTPGQSSSRLSDGTNRRSMLDPQYPAPYGGGGIVSDGPYQRHSQYSTGGLPEDINPDDIADDGDDEFGLSSKNRAHNGAPVATGAGAGAAGAGMLGGLFGKSRPANPSYGPVPGGGLEAGRGEKKLQKKPPQEGMSGRKKRGLIVGLVLGLIILGAIVGGAVGGTIGQKNSSKDGSSAAQDTAKNGDLNKNSPEIQALLNNPALHKVFPGIDYTPWGVQYPLCLKYPPSQNNVTRDLAVLSQLTNTVRLYGTDCNQTEMTLHAIDRLGLTEMKLWLGVWIDSNHTTVTRQLNQLYKVIDETPDKSIFKGVIVGNEALYRAGPDIATAEQNLIGYIGDVRSQLQKRNLNNMMVTTSDLGNNWNAELVQAVDIVMSNVHPFFAGVNIDVAAAWTWDFWETHDVVLTQGTNKPQVISETGWPSGGGKDCGASPTCGSNIPGSVASIPNLNQFMDEWVCQALANGTEYFW